MSYECKWHDISLCAINAHRCIQGEARLCREEEEEESWRLEGDNDDGIVEGILEARGCDWLDHVHPQTCPFPYL
jgi:hypothetical protein